MEFEFQLYHKLVGVECKLLLSSFTSLVLYLPLFFLINIIPQFYQPLYSFYPLAQHSKFEDLNNSILNNHCLIDNSL